MPDLFSRSYEGTLLAQTNRAVVQRQIAYGREQGVPWGISESGYYRFDAAKNYQYQGFGVPGIGRKRGLGEDLVIAPYASLLAAGIAPQAVLANMDALIDLGMLGHFGFYESVDFTGSRLPLGRDHAIVKSYMVHHQGMIMLALTNVLDDNVHVERFHSDPRIQTVELLLQERIPTGVPIEEMPEEVTGAEREGTEPVALSPWTPLMGTPLPQVHYLSNGDYGVLITAGGSGYSQWRDLALTRWRADTTRDHWGTWIYVQDLDSGALWSLTDHPFAPAGTACQVRFYPHQAEFSRHVDDLLFRLDIAVAPDDPVEMRRVVITNRGEMPHHLRLTSYGEVVLAAQNVDRRHPAFNKMFIESEYVPDVASELSSSSSVAEWGGEGVAARMPALIFRRRLRSADEVAHLMGHALVIDEPALRSGSSSSTTYETDRARFLGRGHGYRSPQALSADSGGTGEGKSRDSNLPAPRTGATLDPIMALGQEITVAPRATVTLVYLTVAVDGRPHAVRSVDFAQDSPAEGDGQGSGALSGLSSQAEEGRETRAAVLNLLARYRTLERVERAFEMAGRRASRNSVTSISTAAISTICSCFCRHYSIPIRRCVRTRRCWPPTEWGNPVFGLMPSPATSRSFSSV